MKFATAVSACPCACHWSMLARVSACAASCCARCAQTRNRSTASALLTPSPSQFSSVTLLAGKLAPQRRHILRRDAPFQPLDAIHRHDRDAVAVALEEWLVAADVDLVQSEGVGRRQIFEIVARLV